MSATSPDADSSTATLPDPVAEGQRVVAEAGANDIIMRLIGGVAVAVQSPEEPLLSREIKDIDFVTSRAGKTALAALFQSLGYTSDEQFNAFHGHHRQIYVDVERRRKVDVFVDGFSMCHALPITERLHREPVTVPLAELLLTKLQIVELNERDERDIYNLCFHHEIADGEAAGGIASGQGDVGVAAGKGAGGIASGPPAEIEGGVIATLCARDWGLWRTCKGTIERCVADLGNYGLASQQRELIGSRLEQLWDRIEREPKASKWRIRNRVGDRVRWYEEPEEEAQEQ
ncbi:MAG TPA: hypothetical protein VIX82_04170 [Solirubrobacteraceae bacterium]